MSLKVITNHAGRKFKMGRTRPQPGRPKLLFRDYLMGPSLPMPPAAEHYSYQAEAGLSAPLLNRELGDCVIAGPLHCIDVFMGNAGSTPTIFSDAQVTALYTQIGGYDPTKTDAQGNNPTDNGCDEQAMMDVWKTTGLCGHKIAGWVSIKPEDAKIAMWLLENLIFGVELPDAWVNPCPSHNNFVWDVAGPADQNNGHCFVGVGYNANGIALDSWGLIGLITWAAIEKYATDSANGELYAVITDEIIAKATQKAPSGFAWSDLVADFNALGGNLVLPA